MDLDKHLQQEIQEHFDLLSMKQIQTKSKLEETKSELQDSNNKLKKTGKRLKKNEVKLKENIKDLSQNKRDYEHLKNKFDRLSKEKERLKSELTKATEERDFAKAENIRLKMDSDECQKIRKQKKELLEEIKKWEDENDRLQMGWKEDRERLKQLEYSTRLHTNFEQEMLETPNRTSMPFHVSQTVVRFPQTTARTTVNADVIEIEDNKKIRSLASQLGSNRKRNSTKGIKDNISIKRKVRS